MNILVLSAGTRNAVIRACKKAVGNDGMVIATDCSNLAPAVYEADKFYLVPRITAQGYLEQILDICKQEKISGVFSLIDPELSLLAKERERFLSLGVTPVVSPYDLVETCFDKYRMYQMLQKMGIPTGKCYVEKECFYQAVEKGEIAYPVFVKPIKGSASIHISKVDSSEEIEVLFSRYQDLMIQEFMAGQEYGVDAYIDMISGKCTSVFIKKKIRMRAGETDKSVSVRDEALFDLVKKFVESCGFRGMIDIDIFLWKDTCYISEVNPRFGGGYPHAYACGIDFPAQILNNLAGKENPVAIGDYKEGICMMKYNEIAVVALKEEEIIEG